MPQIWMTYLELAGLADCPLDDARALATERRLKRKHSQDGQTRVQLDAELSWLFIEKVRGHAFDADEAVARLRLVHGQMARAAAPEPSHHHDGDDLRYGGA